MESIGSIYKLKKDPRGVLVVSNPNRSVWGVRRDLGDLLGDFFGSKKLEFDSHGLNVPLSAYSCLIARDSTIVGGVWGKNLPPERVRRYRRGDRNGAVDYAVTASEDEINKVLAYFAITGWNNVAQRSHNARELFVAYFNELP